jgi:hypothetical protein
MDPVDHDIAAITANIFDAIEADDLPALRTNVTRLREIPGANLNNAVRQVDPHHLTPLQYFCYNHGDHSVTRSDLTMARYLIDQGSDVNASASGVAPILYMSPENVRVLPLTNLLLRRGAHPDAVYPDGRGRTLLYNAASDGNLALVKLLVKRGANVDVVVERSRGSTPILAAGLQGNYDVVVYLSKHAHLEDYEDEIRRYYIPGGFIYDEEAHYPHLRADYRKIADFFGIFLASQDRKRWEKRRAIHHLSRVPRLNTRDIKYSIASYLGPSKPTKNQTRKSTKGGRGHREKTRRRTERNTKET